MRDLFNYYRRYALWEHLTFKWQFSMSADPLLNKHMQALENRLKGAIQFLRKTQIHKNGMRTPLKVLPWYLLLGTTGSGKTTLLANSSIHFILEKQLNKDALAAMAPTENCDWWVTHDMVFVDVPGHYLAAKNKKNKLHNQLWESFLSLTKQWRGKHAVNGIILALSLEELMQAEARDMLVRRLSARIHELKAYVQSNIPFYIVVTKCDLLPGFADFFCDCSQEELFQPWGISLPVVADAEGLTTVFTQRFNLLIKRLNEQLIWRLHQEHNPYAKVFIKDFPLQVERLKVALINFLKTLKQHAGFVEIRGVFLTSALQSQPHAEQYPVTLPSTVLSPTFEIMQMPQHKSHSYFIKQFLLHGLIKPVQTSFIARLNKRWASISILTIGVVLFSAAFLGHYGYQKPLMMNMMTWKQKTNTIGIISPSKGDHV